jgi:hypothetical protein
MFLIFSAIIIVLGYIFFILPRYDYVSQTTFLIVPKNARIASNANATVNDIAFIARESLSDLSKKNVAVDVDRIEDHDIMIMSVFSHNPKDTVVAEKKVITTAIQAIAKNYDIDQDILLKVIAKDNAPQRTFLASYAPYVVMVVIIVGVFAGVLLLFSLVSRMRNDHKRSHLVNGEKIFARYHADVDSIKKNSTFQKNDENDKSDYVTTVAKSDAKIDVVDHLKNKVKQKNAIEDEESQIKKIQEDALDMKENILPSGLPATPGNLPVVDLEKIGFSSQETQNNIFKKEDDVQEPTEEELKARLNELLNGKL